MVWAIDDRSKVWHFATTVNQVNDTVSEPHGQSWTPAFDTDLADDATEDLVMNGDQ